MADMPDRRGLRRDARPEGAAYVLVVRGPDGQPRSERFTDVAAYRARLVALHRSIDEGLSVEEIAGLLDA